MDTLEAYGWLFRSQILASGIIPQIALLMGPCLGGQAYHPVMQDFVVQCRKTGFMGIAGPAFVKTQLGEEIDMEALPAGIERRTLGVRVTRLGKTSRAAVFAGGDVTDAPRTVADALGAGKRSAIGIDRYLRRSLELLKRGGTRDLCYGSDGNVSMTRWRGDDPIQRVAPVNEVIESDDLNTNHFERRRRSADEWSTDSDGWSEFAEVNLGLDPTAALAEARRCFNCGVCIHCDLCMIFCPDVAISRRENGGGYEIALEYCKGCGVCVEECPRGAMIMVREAR